MSVLSAVLLSLLCVLSVCVSSVLSQCDGCMGGMAMAGCPYPELCGVLPSLSCLNCSTTASAGCPHPDWCADVQCGGSCMDGMAMPGCHDPAACGFTPTPCVGCIVGKSTPGCLDPSQCAVCNSTGCYQHNTPPCWRCVDGQSSADCPAPEKCGFAAVLCDGCMSGMSMPGCPYPQYCSVAASSDECVMSMVFQQSSRVCVLLSGWYVSSGVQWVVLLLFVAALAGLREFMLVYRQHRARQRRLHDVEVREAAARLAGPPKSAPLAVSSAEQLSLSWPNSTARSARATRPAQPHPIARSADDFDSSRSSPLLSSGGLDSSLLPSHLSSALSWSDVSSCAVDSLIYLLSVTLAYLLMLLVMTYNVALCAAVVLLSAAAHFVVNLCFTQTWRRDAAMRAAERLTQARDAASGGGVGWAGDSEAADVGAAVQSQRWQQRGGYVEVGAPPVVLEEVRAVSDPCCGQVEDIE